MAGGSANPNWHSQIAAANTPETVTMPIGWQRAQVINRDGSAEIYFTLDGSGPVVGGVKTRVLPAVIGADDIPLEYNTAEAIKLISAGTPLYSIEVDV